MLDWKEAFEAGPRECGGKGWNLARLIRYGFPVPETYVLPVSLLRGPLEMPALPGRWAVRSSAVGEDGSEHSFAGVHESFLDVDGTDLAPAVQACLASLQAPRAVAYRERVGLESAACAVVLCRMVAARCAGVAFSCDPTTGRTDLVRVEAVEGLGDRLVAGRVEPVSFGVRRERGRWRLEGSAAPLLDDRQAVELARLVQRVHWAMGDGDQPQDVEWAWDGERFWLLQARPATAVPHRTFPEVADLPVYWSNANMKDAVPGVLSVLGWTFIQEAIPDILYAIPQAVGYPVPPGLRISRRFQGRAYFDFTGMQWGFYDSVGLRPEETVRSIGGHHPLIPVPPGDPLKVRRRAWGRLKLVLGLLGFHGRLRKELRRHHDEVREAARVDVGALSLRELRAFLARMTGLHDRLDPLAGMSNAATGGWQEMLEGALLRSPGLAARLLVGAGDVVSAEQGYRLWDLAETARGDAAVQAWLAERRTDWRDLPPSAFRGMFEGFLHDYGHRAVYEAEVLNPRWVEDPTYLLDQVRAMLEAPPREDPRETARRLRRAAEAELRRVAGWRLPVLRFLVDRMRRGLAAREAAKSAMAAALLPARRLYLELGRRLPELVVAQDVFHLSRADVEAYLEGEWDGTGAGALARDRREQRERWLAEEPPPDVIVQEAPGAPLRRWQGPPPPEGRVLRGLGVCAGRVEGVARVIRHPSEGVRLATGEILVAPSTDPGWTPLFVRAGGLVVETGGALSHGAIVAREYGLPAVTNVAGATERIRDGMRIRVDGEAGVVEL